MAEKTTSTLISKRVGTDKQSEEDFPNDLFKIVSDLTTDGLAIMENGNFLLVNDQMLQTFHLTRDILGTSSLQFIHPDDLAIAGSEINQNRRITYELRVRRGDGVYVHTEVRGSPVMYRGRKCRLLILKDVTARKLSERMFINYLNILDAFPEAISVHDKTGKILFSNSSGYKMIGAKPGTSIKGMNVMEFILPEYHAQIKEDKDKIEKMEAIAGRFVRIKTIDGSEPKSLEISVIPIKWGEDVAIMTVCHDSSLEEQIEKSEIAKQVMQSVNEHLQWEIAEHRNLEAKLKKMVDEKEWLLKEVNHRVKNNLQIITSILNLQINQMQDTKLVPVMREFQNRFYALSSIYSSLYHTEASEEIDISGYLKDLTHNIFISYSDPAKRISMECETDRIFMEYDQAITCGLIVNELVSNSIKYAFPAGKSGNIQVSLKHEGKKMRLEVADNGIGIKAKPKKKTKKAYVSLGLQLVDSLVTQLKNATMKKSSGAKGTTFTITFTAEVIPKRKQTIK